MQIHRTTHYDVLDSSFRYIYIYIYIYIQVFRSSIHNINNVIPINRLSFQTRGAIPTSIYVAIRINTIYGHHDAYAKLLYIATV